MASYREGTSFDPRLRPPAPPRVFATRFATRFDREELLDLGQGSPRDVAATLTEMARINRYLGGYSALTRHLYPRLAAAPGPVTLLDLGTGSGDLPVYAARWARKHGVDLRAIGVDRAARHLDFAAHCAAHRAAHCTAASPVRLLHADALHLPLPAGSVDFAVSTLFMHHFAPDDLVRLLREAFRLARRSLLMSDAVRGALPYLAFKLLPPFFAGNFLTQHDGALSVRRAYTPAELLDLARAAGLPGARVFAHFPWRMTLVVDR